MKTIKFFTYLLICFLVLNSGKLSSQSLGKMNHKRSATVIRGERPPIDISSIPDSAFESSGIRIKFTADAGKLLTPGRTGKSPDGIVTFGIPAVDRLNQKYNVAGSKQSFSIILNDTAFDERHRLWGFHLWQELEVRAGTDIRAMVRDYAGLPEIEIAEPKYRKSLIGDESAVVVNDPGKIQDNPSFTPNDPRFGEQWDLNNTGQSGGTADADIDLPEAWELTKGNSAVIVAIVDAGVAYSHPDLSGSMWSGRGYDFVNNSSVISAGSHGTHVAGIVAANTNNSTGISGVAGGSGTGNGVRLMSCQVANPSWSVSGGFDDAYVWAADHGAAISQNSWGYDVAGVYNQYDLDAIDYFNVNGGGTVMEGGITFFAAGNSNSEAQVYPAYYSGTVSVASTNNSDHKAWYSTYNTHVDISAPGGEGGSAGILSTLPGDNYGFMQGTSMASPHASGVAALIISLAPGQFTAQQVRDFLINSTDNIYALNPTYAGKLGSGRLNANNALLLAQTYINPAIPAPPAAFSAQAVTTGQINLAWTPNTANDSVVVAWNSSYTFGIPAGNYKAGDAITGGGTILYKGKNSSFNHGSLTAGTAYYYAVWSKNGTNYSVVSLNAGDTTSATLPFRERFPSAPFPVNWTQQPGGNTDHTWSVSATSYSGGTANEMKSTYQNVTSGYTRLITPAISTLGISQLSLSFRHRLYAYGVSETVKVQSSVNGLTWMDEAWSQTTTTGIGPALVSTTITSNTNSLTTYIAFTMSGDLSQYYWYLDDVSITPLNTWAGGVTGVPSDWNSSGNWSLQIVPDATHNVIIPGGTTYKPHVTSAISTPAATSDLTISSGATLTIDAGKALTVSGMLNNLAGTSGLIIQSDATGTGSLIHSTTGVDATINRWLTGNASLTAKTYHLVSVPLTPSAVTTSGQFSGSYLYDFNAAANAWQSLGTSTSIDLDETTGYMIYVPVASHVYTFSGPMNSGSFTPRVIYAGEGNNLVPNPYPSAIDWDASNGWTKTNIANAIYLWPSGGSNYASYVDGIASNGGSGIIPAGQAFMIKAIGAPGLTMTNSVRVHNNHAFFKQVESTENLLRIKATANSIEDETVIRFTGKATANADPDYDAWKLAGSEDAPQLSSVSQDLERLSINSLPLSSAEVIVPLNFEHSSAGNCMLGFTGLESFHPNSSVILEDKLTGVFTDLKKAISYAFIHDPANAADRFLLHFNGLTGINSGKPGDNVIRISDNTVFINTTGLNAKNFTLGIFNTAGQRVFTRQIRGNSTTSFNPGVTGINFVQLKSDQNIYTLKGFFR